MLSALRYYRSTRRGSFAAPGGESLRWLECGYGDETVVVIPGIDDAVLDFQDVPWFWAWYFRPLADPGRRIVMLGRRRGLREQASIADIAGTYASVIEREFGAVHVVGISMGGMIAQHLAASRPDLVQRLVLAVTAFRVSDAGHAGGQELVDLAGANRWHAFASAANRICFAGVLRAVCALLLFLLAPLAWLLERVLRAARAATDFRISAEACAAHDGSTLLPNVAAPTLIWGAEGDVLFPPALLADTQATLSTSERSMVDGAHAAFLQERGSFHAALDGFLAKADVPRGADTDVEVAIVGSGFSGLGMAIRLKQRGRGSFLVFEKGASIGGTWRDNDYPGCACDVPSHLYSFSFEQNPRWSRRFSPQSEIREYLERCVEKYGLRRHVRVNAQVQCAEFDEAGAFWRVVLGDGTVTTARHLVFGIGALSRPAIPKIDGIEQFQGRAFHSAQWDHSLELAGKRVAVVGTGASAIQIVPQIAGKVSKLSVFQRTPPWVLPKPDRAMTRLEQWVFGVFPLLQNLYRLFIYCTHELRVLGFALHPKIMNAARWLGAFQIRRQIRDPELRRKVTPSYMPGCKRILIANDYYPALARPNVSLVADVIVRATERGLVTSDGQEHELDAIVYGTGFRVTDLLSPLAVYGLGGVDLNQAWKDRMEAYVGTSISGFPNFYMLLGPNTGLGHNSMIYMIESQIEMVLRAMRSIERKGARVAHVKPHAQHAYNTELQPRLQRSIWASGCQSWYLDASGHNATAWPGFTFVFRMRALAFDESAYEYDPAPAYVPTAVAPPATGASLPLPVTAPVSVVTEGATA